MADEQANMANFASFIPTTNAWEIEQISSLPIAPQLKEILLRSYQVTNNIAVAVNTKITGIYGPTEFCSGALYFSNSNQPTDQPYLPSFTIMINCGVLPNATTSSIYHHIPVNSGYTLMKLSGGATNENSTSMIPLPYSSPTLNKNIEVEVTQDQILITTGIDRTSYTKSYIVLEYLKQ